MGQAGRVFTIMSLALQLLRVETPQDNATVTGATAVTQCGEVRWYAYKESDMAWVSSQAPFSPPMHNVQDEKAGEKPGSHARMRFGC